MKQIHPRPGGPPMTPTHALFNDLTSAYAEYCYPISPASGDLSAYGAADHTMRFCVWLSLFEPEYWQGLVALLRSCLAEGKNDVLPDEQTVVMREYVRRNPIPSMAVEANS